MSKQTPVPVVVVNLYDTAGNKVPDKQQNKKLP